MELEATLQEAIDSGNRVWVVGDIHGHIKTLEELISQIDLESGHKLISLGDMIDRGPDSASVLEIFRRAENIENFNKKALYIMIREMSGSKTQHITRIVNIMKKYHFGLISEFRKAGDIDIESTRSFL